MTFSRNGMPVRESRSKVEFSAPLFPTSMAMQTSDSQSLMAFLSGNYHFTLPERNSLSVNWSMGTNGYHTGSEYRLGDAEPVANGQKGKLWYPSLLVSHSKRFGHGNSLNTVLNGYYYIHDARYSGTSQERSRKVNSETQLQVNYSQRWDLGLFVSGAAGAYYTLMRENGVNHVHRWSPYGRFRTDYTLNGSNSFLLYGEWSRTGVLSANTTGVIRREDELMWSQGNPDLRAREEKWGMLSYTFMPRGNLSLGVNIVYRDISNGQVAEFLTVPGHDGVVRTYSGDSRERELSCNVSATLGLFNRSLILSGTLSAWRQRCSGLFSGTDHYASGSVSARWSRRNVSAGLMYRSPGRSIFQQQGYRTRTPDAYSLDVTYSWRELKVELMSANWFGDGMSRRSCGSAHYSSTGSEWLRSYSRILSLAVSYTFPYGKKVQRGDEFSAEGGSAPNM